MKRALASFLLFAGAIASCERVEVPANKTDMSSAEHNLSAPTNSTPTLIDRIAGARMVTKFQGVRRVELHFVDGGIQRTLVLRERVSADGHGAYAIEALDILEPQMPDSQRTLVLMLQSLQQGMNWRYRDFGIRSVALFLQNYRVIDNGAAADVAGRACMALDVERTDQSGSVYSLSVDNQNDLILDVREESAEGVLLSEMSYESIDFAPDLSGVAWHQSLNNEQLLPTVGPLLSQVGFEARAPRMLPAGYQLLERAKIFHPQESGTWVKETFSDGVENLFFLHGGPIVGGNGLKSGVPEIQADLVEVTAVAPWTVARGNLRLERVIALGKVSEQDLLTMLRSAME